MRVVVDYQEEHLDLDVADRLVASFRGPSGIPEADRIPAIDAALAQPADFPPVPSLFVPGDRAAVALDSRLPDASRALKALLPLIREAVGESGEIAVVSTPGGDPSLAGEVPLGIRFEVHDPSDRNQLAYLASTKGGRRIYLNRSLTDADVVIPIGEIRFDPVHGIRGPWSTLFPDLSDEETRKDSTRIAAQDLAASAKRDSVSRSGESLEASWLLGSQFSIGFIPARSNFSEVIAGLSISVHDQGLKALERDWNFVADSRAELVVAGVGRPGVPTGIEELVSGIEAASRLVQHGGKIAILSRARGPLGPALRRLIAAGDPRRGSAALKLHERDEDHALALRLNRALVWADVYLLSALDPETVEDLSMVPLEKAGEAARLVANSRSCIVLSQADLASVGVTDDT